MPRQHRDTYQARRLVDAAVDQLVAAIEYADEHPEDPHGPDHVDYQSDQLTAAVQDLAQLFVGEDESPPDS